MPLPESVMLGGDLGIVTNNSGIPLGAVLRFDGWHSSRLGEQ